MRDVTETPRPFKKFEFSDKEFKQLLGIDWPGNVLTVSTDFYHRTVTVTMSTRPDEVRKEN
jgi:hypothetical protein